MLDNKLSMAKKRIKKLEESICNIVQREKKMESTKKEGMRQIQ